MVTNKMLRYQKKNPQEYLTTLTSRIVTEGWSLLTKKKIFQFCPREITKKIISQRELLIFFADNEKIQLRSGNSLTFYLSTSYDILLFHSNSTAL